jgi:hypothetical protein
VLLLALVVLIVAVPPAGDFPVDEDWLDARVVQALLEHGVLEVSLWTGASFVLQAYWGGLFARRSGLTHEGLRASTLMLGAAGVVGVYRLACRVPILGARCSAPYSCSSAHCTPPSPTVPIASWPTFLS